MTVQFPKRENHCRDLPSFAALLLRLADALEQAHDAGGYVTVMLGRLCNDAKFAAWDHDPSIGVDVDADGNAVEVVVPYQHLSDDGAKDEHWCAVVAGVCARVLNQKGIEPGDARLIREASSAFAMLTAFPIDDDDRRIMRSLYLASTPEYTKSVAGIEASLKDKGQGRTRKLIEERLGKLQNMGLVRRPMPSPGKTRANGWQLTDEGRRRIQLDEK